MKNSGFLLKVMSIGFLVIVMLTIGSCKKLVNFTNDPKLIIDYDTYIYQELELTDDICTNVLGL